MIHSSKILSLDSISEKYGINLVTGGDKCIRHNYCEKYELHLGHLRQSKLNILEIGVMDGRSVRMWKDYFEISKIVGIDNRPNCINHAEDRVFIEIGDQKDSCFLEAVNKKHGPFDIIIDDGSHRWLDIITSFKTLFPLLNSGGTYVVEDLHTSYSKESHSQGSNLSPIEYFKQVVDKINMHGQYSDNRGITYPRAVEKQDTINNKQLSRSDCDYDAYSVCFYPSICFIKKELICNSPYKTAKIL